ncbi:hypothetical protein DXG01_006404 [Tephrocybe rancida]|nr:hypothetical protein DXG01_006404 [Tephrocybe rancida]
MKPKPIPSVPYVMRPLTLHASALNDEEYELYTTSLKDLNDDSDPGTHDDAYYEAMQIGVREVRGWLRGRYAHLQPGVIDSILRFFAPGMGATDILSGGQLFAALRLVVHAEQGKGVERSLGFVQAHPAPPKVAPPIVSPHSTHNPFVSRVPPLPPRKLAPPPPKHVSSSSILLPPSRKSTSPTRPAPSVPHVPPVPPPVHPKPSHVTSNLMKQSLQASKTAQTMKRAEAQLEKERVLQVLKSSAVVSGGYSLAGARVERSSVVVGTSVRTSHHNYPTNHAPTRGGEMSPSLSSGESAKGGRAPPLPRRRNTHQQQPSPPVSVSSIEQVALAKTPSEPSNVPPANSRHPAAPLTSPAPPPSIRSTNPFPTASNAQSSATGSSNNPYRRPSTSSYKSFTASPQGSPSRGTTDLPPPTHPDRMAQPLSANIPSQITASPFGMPTTNDSEGSPTTRVFRSKSLHHPSPPLPPLPAAPPRRRPESVQVLADSPSLLSLSRHPSFSSSGRGPHKRQASLSASFSSLGLERDREREEGELEGREHDRESPLGKFARSWQPRLEKARFKAEAGLSRRGYVRERSRSKGPEETEDLLVPSSPFSGGKVEGARMTGGWRGRGFGYGYGEEYDPPSVDGSADAGSDNNSSPHRETERDNLKWPVAEGEGWRPL